MTDSLRPFINACKNKIVLFEAEKAKGKKETNFLSRIHKGAQVIYYSFIIVSIGTFCSFGWL